MRATDRGVNRCTHAWRGERCHASEVSMSDQPVDRIEAALARIEAAVAARSAEAKALARRHAQLRERVAEAVTAIDDLVTEREGR